MLLFRGSVPLSSISLPNLDASIAIQPPTIAIQLPISTIPCNSLYLLANPMLPFPMFCSPSSSTTVRSPHPRSAHSNHCHPEHSDRPKVPAPSERFRPCRKGSAFRFSHLRALSLNAFNFCSPSPLNIPTFKPFNLQPTPFSLLVSPNSFGIRTSENAPVTPVESAVSKHRT